MSRTTKPSFVASLLSQEYWERRRTIRPNPANGGVSRASVHVSEARQTLFCGLGQRILMDPVCHFFQYDWRNGFFDCLILAQSPRTARLKEMIEARQ